MGEGINRGLRNALVQRVKRHTRLTTLFRVPVSTSVPDLSPVATEKLSAQSTQPLEGVIQASLPPPTASLPQGFLVGEIAPRSLLSPFQDTMESVVNELPVAGTSSPARSPESKQELVLQHEGKHSFSEVDWRRLQTIFRKHQEKSDQSQLGESMSEDLNLAETPEPGTSAPLEDRDVANAVAAAGVSFPPNIPERLDGDRVQTKPNEAVTVLSGSADRPRQDRTEPPEVSAQPGSHPQEGVVQASGATQKTITENRSPRIIRPEAEDSPRTEIAEYSEENTATGREIQANSQTIQTSVSPHENLSVGQEENATPGNQVTPPVMPMNSKEGVLVEKQQSTQSLPLQDAWPVQRLPVEPDVTEFVDAASLDDKSIPKSAPALLGVEPAANLESPIFREFNDAEIEFIPPRQPRPLHYFEEGHSVEEKINRGKEAFSEKSADKDSDTGSNPTTSSGSQAVVQTKMDEGSGDSDGLYEPDFIQTAIGPLPSDLWQLIGHSPPMEKPFQPGGSEPLALERKVEICDREGLLPDTTGLFPSFSSTVGNQVSTRNAPAILQRETMPDQGQDHAEIPAAAVAPQNPPSKSILQKSEQELKIDDLARQVYVEIHRRLVVDWERRRY